LRITNDIVNHIVDGRKTGDFTTHTYHIRAAFQSDFDFHAYPFDKQILSIEFRHADKTREQLIYISDILGMRHFIQEQDRSGEDYNSLPGWEINRAAFFQDIITNDSTLGVPASFDVENSIRFSRFNTKVQIKRQVLGFLFKDVFSVFIMVLILYIIYFVSCDQFELRLSIGMGVLMTNAFLHQDVSSNLQVSYILAIDYAFFAVYGLSALSIIVSLLGDNLSKNDKVDVGNSMDKVIRVIHPATVAIVIFLIGYKFAW